MNPNTMKGLLASKGNYADPVTTLGEREKDLLALAGRVGSLNESARILSDRAHGLADRMYGEIPSDPSKVNAAMPHPSGAVGHVHMNLDALAYHMDRLLVAMDRLERIA